MERDPKGIPAVFRRNLNLRGLVFCGQEKTGRIGAKRGRWRHDSICLRPSVPHIVISTKSCMPPSTVSPLVLVRTRSRVLYELESHHESRASGRHSKTPVSIEVRRLGALHKVMDTLRQVVSTTKDRNSPSERTKAT